MKCLFRKCKFVSIESNNIQFKAGLKSYLPILKVESNFFLVIAVLFNSCWEGGYNAAFYHQLIWVALEQEPPNGEYCVNQGIMDIYLYFYVDAVSVAGRVACSALCQHLFWVAKYM